MKTPGNEQIECQETSLVIRFPGKRNCLSTSWLNGGFRQDLRAIFNNQIPLAACEACHSGGSVKAYLESVADSLSLDPATATGLVTRAEMKNAAIVSESFRELAACAIVTAGIDKNGGRAGDPSSYYENGNCFEPVGGTINTILIIGADLPEYAMSRAIMTATEAKTAALQQVMGRSIYSTGIATGSGTDMIAVVSDPCSNLHLSDAGKHSKLGELIGRSVIRATLAALEKETGLSPESQRNALVRLSRYHVTWEDLWNAVTEVSGQNHTDPAVKERFMVHLNEWAKDPGSVALVAAALHVIDEAEWDLIPRKDATRAITRIFQEGACVVPAVPDDPKPLQSLTEALARLIYEGSCGEPGTMGNEWHDEHKD